MSTLPFIFGQWPRLEQPTPKHFVFITYRQISNDVMKFLRHVRLLARTAPSMKSKQIGHKKDNPSPSWQCDMTVSPVYDNVTCLSHTSNIVTMCRTTTYVCICASICQNALSKRWHLLYVHSTDAFSAFLTTIFVKMISSRKSSAKLHKFSRLSCNENEE